MTDSISLAMGGSVGVGMRPPSAFRLGSVGEAWIERAIILVLRGKRERLVTEGVSSEGGGNGLTIASLGVQLRWWRRLGGQLRPSPKLLLSLSSCLRCFYAEVIMTWMTVRGRDHLDDGRVSFVMNGDVRDRKSKRRRKEGRELREGQQ